MLVVLDNARDGRAGPPAAARHPGLRRGSDQPGLAGRPGGPATAPRRLDLDLLPAADDAVGLLRTLIGGRADADPVRDRDTGRSVLRGCRWRCGWPPSWPPPARPSPLAELADELAGHRQAA